MSGRENVLREVSEDPKIFHVYVAATLHNKNHLPSRMWKEKEYSSMPLPNLVHIDTSGSVIIVEPTPVIELTSG